MPDNSDDNSPIAAHAARITRRSVLGLGVATAILASSRRLDAGTGPDTSARIANRGSIVEFSAGVGDDTVLASFRNAESHFEWVTPASALAPSVKYSDGTSPAWHGLPFKSTPGDVTL